MSSHPDRVRRNYTECDIRGYHNLFVSNDSHIAPFINEDGTRTTIRYCHDCDEKVKFTRTQEEFEIEMAIAINKMMKVFSK